MVRVYEEIINGANTSAIVVDDGRLVGILSPDNVSRYLLVQSSIKSPRRRRGGSRAAVTRDFANSSASARDFNRSSNCISSTSRRICPTVGPGLRPSASKSCPVNNGGRFHDFRWHLGGLGFQELIILQVAMAGGAVDPMQFQFVGKRLARQNALQFGGPHFLDELKPHVLAHAQDNLLDLVVREPQPPQDGFRHLRADAVVFIEPNPVRRALKRRRFAHVVQQHRKRQRHARMGWQRVQHHSRVGEHVALRMELRRLLHALHGGDLRQDFGQQPAGPQKLQSASGVWPREES